MAKQKKRKTRTHLKGPNNSAATSTNAPKSFVIRTGTVGRSVTGLVQDVRKVMEPNTATRLKERKSNKLRDFVAMSGPLGVSHLMIFNQTDNGVNLRISRCPRGPTCTFRVNKFALINDVTRSQKRPRAPGGEFSTEPLLVLNNFASEARHLKLLVTTFQNLFPPIKVQSMHLSQARRVVLLSYNAETDTIEWRHFLISIRPVGVSRNVRRIIEGTNRPGGSKTAANGQPVKRKGKGLPNLGNVGDISEYVLGRTQRSGSVGAASDTDLSEAESELEDMADPNNAVNLFQRYVGRGNETGGNEQRAVRLREIGPRMELRLMKIEEGIEGGETIYHSRVKKTAKEVNELKHGVAEKKKLKEQRKQEQDANVQRKLDEKAAKKTQSKGLASGAARDEDQEETMSADGEPSQFESEEELVEGLDSEAEVNDDDEDDEFEYEDRFGAAAASQDADLFDESGSDEDAINAAEESEDTEDDFDDGDDDDDLEPIAVGGGLTAYDDDDGSGAEEPTSKAKAFKKRRTATSRPVQHRGKNRKTR